VSREPLDPARGGLESGGPDERAANLVVHALLEFRAHADEAAREGRVGRVMAGLDDKIAPAPLTSAATARRWRVPRLVTGLAAALLLGFIALQIGLPTEKSALVQVQESIDAMRSAGAQRYEARVLSWAVDATEDEPAIVDTRAPGLVVVRHRPPWEAHQLTAGRDAAGLWAIGRDGGVIRGGEARRMWPPWATIDGEVVLGQSIDGLLAAMLAAYTVHVAPGEELERAGVSRAMDRLSATRNAARGPQPTRIDVWIDAQTRVVERLVYSWDKQEPDDQGPGGPRRGPPRGGPPPGAPPGPPPGPPPDGGPPPPRGPGGPPGGPDGGPGGRRPGHPRMITFERVEAPVLGAEWFEARTHTGQ
jgi:hypothetical protein